MIPGWEIPAVRVALINRNAFDSQTKSARTRNLNMTQEGRLAVRRPATRKRSAEKRSAEIDAERPEEEVTRRAEAPKDALR